MGLLEFDKKGIYCRKAGVYIDPWRPVSRALITHAHSDHARYGMGSYLAHRRTIPVLRHRLGRDITVQSLEYGESLSIDGVRFSFHPAGHVIGSSQIRVEYNGEVWVVSGDYKLENDGISEPFEPIACGTFVTESTFGLPIFRWRPQRELAAEMNDWWRANRNEGKTSIICAYSLGKAQRIISLADPSIGPMYAHGAVESVTALLRSAETGPLPVRKIPYRSDRAEFVGSLIIAPPSAVGTPWMKRFLPYSVAAASGWMALRGVKRRRGFDRGFVVSDHADFESLNLAVKETGATRVFVTHGYTAPYARWLSERGYDAHEVRTEYKGETIQDDEETVASGEEV